jgi:hypothetical protein
MVLSCLAMPGLDSIHDSVYRSTKTCRVLTACCFVACALQRHLVNATEVIDNPCIRHFDFQATRHVIDDDSRTSDSEGNGLSILSLIVQECVEGGAVSCSTHCEELSIYTQVVTSPVRAPRTEKAMLHVRGQDMYNCIEYHEYKYVRRSEL